MEFNQKNFLLKKFSSTGEINVEKTCTVLIWVKEIRAMPGYNNVMFRQPCQEVLQ
jgi:hypothetical protein